MRRLEFSAVSSSRKLPREKSSLLEVCDARRRQKFSLLSHQPARENERSGYNKNEKVMETIRKTFSQS